MKKIMPLIVSLLLMSNALFAADQKLDRKQIYELRKECGKSAAEFTNRVKLCDGVGNYTNHYNIKLNICFVNMSASCNSDKGKENKFWAESVIDVNENKEHATYVGSGKSIGDEPSMCYVGGKQCKGLFEFHELIKPYMSE